MCLSDFLSAGDDGLAKESALIAGGNNHQTEVGREEGLYPHVRPWEGERISSPVGWGV